MFKLLLPVILLVLAVVFVARLMSGNASRESVTDATARPAPKSGIIQPIVVTLTMLATLFVAYMFGNDVPAVAWLLKNLYITIPAYVVIGVVWMFGEWIGRGMSHAAKLRELKAEFFAVKRLGDINKPVPQDLRDEWYEFSFPYSLRRTPADQKTDLMLWFGCWPVYTVYRAAKLAWFLLHAPATYLLSGIYLFFSRWLRTISDWQQKTFDDDLRK